MMKELLKNILMIDRFSYFENIMNFKKSQKSVDFIRWKKKEDQI